MITVDIDKNAISGAIEGERIALAKRIRLATEQTGRAELVDPLRAMTRDALNSKRLPTTWRVRIYPAEARNTLSPAVFAFSRAPEIMIAFEEGPIIQPVGGKKYLWVPTENVPRGRGGKRLSPQEVKAKVGRFSFIPLRNGGFVAVAQASRGTRRAHRRGGARTPTIGREKGVEGERLAFFILKKRVRLRKRLNIASIAERAGAKYTANYERAANAS
ncbi:MAG: hypothetical protein FJX45_10455 [Alphaproteobacteria bacterium]|nr:hypothetical protein [Alphaproteobacteria bacterium]MBM3654886.1 hypothetical protein [Alphaproteobacteria bacterium]